MSHYTVALLTKNKPTNADIANILAPYNENNDVPVYIEKTKEELIARERNYLERQKISQYDKYIKDPEKYEKEYSHAPKHLEYLKNEFFDLYNAPDEVIYKKELEYYEEEQISKAGQTVNTSSVNIHLKNGTLSDDLKDFLTLKDKKAEAVEIIVSNSAKEIVFNKTMLVKDFKGFSLSFLNDGDYLVVKNELAPEGAVLSTYNPLSKWDWYVKGGRWSGRMPVRSDVEDFNSCQIKDVIWSVEELMTDDYIKEDYEDYKNKKLKYSEENILSYKEFVEEYFKFSTYAVVDEKGVWHEPGQMLYFAISTATKEESDSWYKNYYNNFIKDRDPETYITLIDCHI